MIKLLVAFTCAVIFGVGLGFAGMTLPAKVIGFLDIFGQWDPSLAFVMIGAITVHSLSYHWISRRSSPVLDVKFHLPSSKKIDKNLIVGSFIFGLGWGLGGFCPGPALVASITGKSSVLIFIASMAAGVYVHAGVNRMIQRRKV